MTITNIYRKSSTFFSRARQEKIVSRLDHEFYAILTPDAQDPCNVCQLHMGLEKFCTKIRSATMCYHFEDDLLEHLFNLMAFSMQYIENIRTNRCPEKDLLVQQANCKW